MYTRQFWIPTVERAVKTFAQTLATLLVASNTGLLTAPWTTSLSAAGMAAVVSVLTSMASLRIGPPDSPSVVRADPPTAAATPLPPAPPTSRTSETPVAPVISIERAPQPASPPDTEAA